MGVRIFIPKGEFKKHGYTVLESLYKYCKSKGYTLVPTGSSNMDTLGVHIELHGKSSKNLLTYLGVLKLKHRVIKEEDEIMENPNIPVRIGIAEIMLLVLSIAAGCFFYLASLAEPVSLGKSYYIQNHRKEGNFKTIVVQVVPIIKK